MKLSIDFRNEKSDGIRRELWLFIVADRADSDRIASVEFDLGPTFSEPLRRASRREDSPARENNSTHSDTWGIKATAYSSFDVVAHVGFADETTQILERHIAVVAEPLPVPGAEDLTVEQPTRPVAAWGGIALEFFVAAVVLILALFTVAIWPGGSDSIALPMTSLAVSITMSYEVRLMLLAAGAGGLGGALQAAYSIVSHPEVHTLTAAWVRWYLLRPAVGAVLGVVSYLILRATLIAPGASAHSISSVGLSALTFAAGLASSRFNSHLNDIIETLTALARAEPDSMQGEDVMSTTSDNGMDSNAHSRKRDIDRAESILRGTVESVPVTFALAERLKNCNEFGYARKLFGRIRNNGDYEGLNKSPATVGQRHALCTYKDPDLSAADRFARALEILDEVDLFKMSEPEQQESFGLRGAVFKRRWQVEGQRADLVRSRDYYLRGYALGPELDCGYTGINAAYVLDLLAREEAVEAREAGDGWTLADQLWHKAREIRTRLVDLLPQLPSAPGRQWLEQEWWFGATLAEALFGLGRFADGLQALRNFNRVKNVPHQNAPVEILNAWEFESTITQLASLCRLQADLAERMRAFPESEVARTITAGEFSKGAREALREYLGKNAPGLDRAFLGKIGLALSGGGFRASLFHIGVLAYLAERDVLRHIEVLSCVSGGSIVGAHYYLEVKRLLELKAECRIEREDYIALVMKLERDFLAGIQTNIRSRTFGSILANLRVLLQTGYTTTRRLGQLYEALLYALVQDGRGDQPRYLHDLLVRPKDESTEFKPKYDNWRRTAKVPILVLNATTLNTGHNWQFTASWMGEPPGRLDAEIGGNYRLRRMYHWEAPRLQDKWSSWYRRPFAPPDYQHFRLGEAVAASSCVPGLFEPLVLNDLYDGKTVRLVDGGVYDNQGIASLLEQDCTIMIVSDASGQMEAQDVPTNGRLGVPLRSFSLSMARVRQAQFQELAARRRSGLLRGLMFLHLRKDLDADPVDWRECQDPYEASDEVLPAARRGVLTRYGLQKSVQRLLSAIRTDLDSFTEVEAFALMVSGYRQAALDLQQIPDLASQLEMAAAADPAAKPLTSPAWRFLRIEPLLGPGPGFDQLTAQLHVGRLSAGKLWILCRPLTVLAFAVLVSALAGLFRLWYVYQNTSLLTVRTLGIFLAVLGLSLVFPHLVRIIRYRETFRGIWLRSLGAAVIAIGFKIHLVLFDPLFLLLGRANRLISKRRDS